MEIEEKDHSLNDHILDEITFGGGLRTQLDPPSCHLSSDGISWQGLPIPSSYDLKYDEISTDNNGIPPFNISQYIPLYYQQSLNSSHITSLVNIFSRSNANQPNCSLDRMRIHPVLNIMADLLCDVGQLDMSQQVLQRAHRLLNLSGQAIGSPGIQNSSHFDILNHIHQSCIFSIIYIEYIS